MASAEPFPPLQKTQERGTQSSVVGKEDKNHERLATRRRRAVRSRYLAALWLSLSVVILVATYISLPIVAGKTLSTLATSDSPTASSKGAQDSAATDAKASLHVQIYTIGTLALGLIAISFACFLLGRSAFVEMELAARFDAFADALCIAGDDFDRLEKFANLLMPSTKYLSVPEIFSTKDMASVLETLKQVQGLNPVVCRLGGTTEVMPFPFAGLRYGFLFRRLKGSGQECPLQTNSTSS